MSKYINFYVTKITVLNTNIVGEEDFMIYFFDTFDICFKSLKLKVVYEFNEKVPGKVKVHDLYLFVV